jgi:hypothetical protein
MEPFDINPILRELGRLVFNFNAAEHGLRRLAFLLIDPEDPRTGEITIDRLGANGLEELVHALAPHRLGKDAEITVRLQSAVKRFGEIRIRRNDIVHAIWGVPNEATDLEDMVAIKWKFRKGIHTTVSTKSTEAIAK